MNTNNYSNNWLEQWTRTTEWPGGLKTCKTRIYSWFMHMCISLSLIEPPSRNQSPRNLSCNNRSRCRCFGTSTALCASLGVFVTSRNILEHIVAPALVFVPDLSTDLISEPSGVIKDTRAWLLGLFMTYFYFNALGKIWKLCFKALGSEGALENIYVYGITFHL